MKLVPDTSVMMLIKSFATAIGFVVTRLTISSSHTAACREYANTAYSTNGDTIISLCVFYESGEIYREPNCVHLVVLVVNP